MPGPSNPPDQPATGPARLWRIRRSPAVSAAAMVLFLVVSVLWLVAAGTAQVGVEAQPCLGPPCPQPPSYASFGLWLLPGIAGTALTLASFVLVARSAVRERPKGVSARQVRLALVTGVAGALAEVAVVLLVTHVAVVTAPLGFENSGEAGAAIGILAAAQPVLAGALALAWGRLLRVSPEALRPARHPILVWRTISGLGGMVLTCAAFAAWSLRDGTALLVHTRLIAGTATITNAGAWWPGLFAAMAALTLVAAACAPGLGRSYQGPYGPELDPLRNSLTFGRTSVR